MPTLILDPPLTHEAPLPRKRFKSAKGADARRQGREEHARSLVGELETEPVLRVLLKKTEVHQMLEAGLFMGQRFELINGDLINKTGQNPPHAITLRICLFILGRLFLRRLQVQSPIEAGSDDRELSEPEPDLAILSEDKPDFASRLPQGHELALAIEVADTTLHYDLTSKRDLYARAAVP